MLNRIVPLLLLFVSLSAQATYYYYDETTPETYLVDIGTPPACDYVINSNAGWDQINNAAYRVFCVAPGDYTTKGRVTITADGTAESPRWIRYYDSTGETGDAVHPYAMSTAKQAILESLYFSGADYWIMDRMTFKPRSSFALEAILTAQADHNVFSRSYFDGQTVSMVYGIKLYNGSDYSTIQHCVFANQKKTSDGVAMQLHGMNYDGSHPVDPVKYARMISNECFDVNDCVHFSGNNPTDPEYGTVGEEDYEGAVVYDNDFYLTDAYRTDCLGNADPNGVCSWAENAMDIKSGTESTTNRVLIAHNRMWGFKRTDPTKTASSSFGECITDHNNTHNVSYEGNVIAECPRLLVIAFEQTNSIIAGNLLAGTDTETGAGQTVTYGLLYYSSPNTNGLVTENTISESTGTNVRALDLRNSGYSFTNNFMINADGSAGNFSGTASGNEYYDSDVPSWDSSPAVNTTLAGSDWENQFCTTRKRITAPETWCLDNALYATGAEPPTAPTGVRIID